MHTRKCFKVALMLVGLMTLFILFYAIRPAQPIKIIVSFVGYTNDVAGAAVATIMVTNSGDLKVVAWGYYHLEAKQSFRVLYPTIFGSCIFLEPGRSVVVAVHPPETKGPWRVSIGCGGYNWRCRWALFATHLPPRICEAIPERFRDVPKELVASDWID
jgi:hypothetical protein